MRFAIIGCGLVGTKRADAARRHELVVVCDRDRSRAEVLARRTGARAVDDWRDAIGADVDAVIVATTHDQLAKLAIAALQEGRHVMIEKPAGRHVDELRDIAEIATRRQLVVKVGFNHRFHPAFQRARELIDQGSHLIDLSRWFLGDLSLRYAAAPTYFWDISVDDNCFLALEAANGQMAWLHASWTEWKNLFSFELAGRKGKLAIDGLGGSYGVERLTFYRMLPEMGPPETTTWEYPFADHSWDAEFADFVNAIQNGPRPCGDIHDAIANLEIIRQVYQSKHT